jgi:hypothetical protein
MGLAGWDLVLIGRDGTIARPFALLVEDLRGALRQAGPCCAMSLAATALKGCVHCLPLHAARRDRRELPVLPVLQRLCARGSVRAWRRARHAAAARAHPALQPLESGRLRPRPRRPYSEAPKG